jgi:hypothetical protein
MSKIHVLMVLVLLAAAGCKDPYEAELRPSERSMLVVEGHLTKGAPTTFRLSRTVQLSAKDTILPEKRAVVTVEGTDNFRAPFAEKANGFYEANLPTLQTGKDYRLRIRTANGKEYFSDFVTLKTNPPIDSISWRWETEGVRLFVSTHDPNNNTRYYRWDYEETWEQRSNFVSKYKKGSPTTVIPRIWPDEDVSICWRTTASSNINLGSSAKLGDDVIHEAPLILIPNKHEKLAWRYSVLVRQYALAKDAYEYLEVLKKNSETLGSIFDAQPSEISGNIHSVSDPEEPVIGFVTASEARERRIFITRLQLLDWGWYQFCMLDEVVNRPDSIEMYLGPDHPPIGPKYSERDPNVITHWYAADAVCVDCTTRGGTTKKPSFW